MSIGRSGIDNRKILEELQAQKKLLLKPGTAPYIASSTASSASSGSTTVTAGAVTGDTAHHLLTPAQRQALLQVNNSSFGHFVAQDSLFGNLVMPVIPRLDPPSQQQQSTTSSSHK